MQSFFEQRGPRLDTSLPSVRHVQDLIRRSAPVHLELEGGHSLQGTIRWQDVTFLAVEPEQDRPVVLVNREKLVLLRAID